MLLKVQVRMAMAVVLLLSAFTLRAQRAVDTALLKHEVGIDVANILTFLDRSANSFMVNYRYHLRGGNTFRGSVNFDFSTDDNQGLYFDVGLGYEKDFVVNRWCFYPGTDLTIGYAKANFQPNWMIQTGISPLLGAKFYIDRHFSVSTEVKLDFLLNVYRNPESYDPVANREEFEVSIGSVGIVYVNYHFNLKRAKHTKK